MYFFDKAINNANKAKKEYPDSVILVRMLGYFAINEDAAVLNKELSREIHEYRGTKYAHFPHHELTKNLPLLVRKGYRVAIIEWNKTE